MSLLSLAGAEKVHHCYKQQWVMGWLQCIDTHSRENKVWAGLYEQVHEGALLWMGSRGERDSLQPVCAMPSFAAYLETALEVSSTNTLSYEPIRCHLLKIHCGAAYEDDEYGKVCLFHCIKVLQSVKVMPPWKCINYSSWCKNLIFNKQIWGRPCLLQVILTL